MFTHTDTPNQEADFCATTAATKQAKLDLLKRYVTELANLSDSNLVAALNEEDMDVIDEDNIPNGEGDSESDSSSDEATSAAEKTADSDLTLAIIA